MTATTYGAINGQDADFAALTATTLTVGGGPVLPATTGSTYYVHSGTGSSGNAGTSTSAPKATIDQAINLCTANKNDVVVVMPGHAETVAAAGGIDADVAGITILGYGNGSNVPVITFATATTADMDIDAANIRVRNLRFICNIASQDSMIDVNSSGAIIEDCFFEEGSATGLAFIDVTGAGANACDDTIIRRNRMYAPTAGNYDRAIELGEVADGVIIEDNLIRGDFDDACIHNPTGKVLTNLHIRRNTVVQLKSGDHAIELVSACTGTATDNRLSTDAQATAFDAGAMACVGNLWNAVAGGDTEGVPVNPTNDAPTNMIGYDDADNGVATSSVVANGDGSVLERVELLQQATPAFALNRNAGNYLSVTADFTSATWNTAAAHEIATVTGMVHLVIIPEVTGAPTSAGSGATLILGDETTTNSIIASTDAENLATGEVWFDATDTRTLAARSIFEKTDVVVGGGKDIGYTIGTEALTGGSIVFHMWWWPISSSGAVVAGAGGAL
jgi:hypothetical protein